MSADDKSEYTAPAIVSELRTYLNLPRFQYSNDFAQFVDVESDDHVKYKEGLIAIGGSIALVFLLWATILLILRCTGKTAGCAGGFPFKIPASRPSGSSSAGSTEAESSSSNEDSSTKSSGPSDETNRSRGRSRGRAVRSSPLHLSRRERRTQAFFFLSSLVTLLSLPPIALFVVMPLLNTAEKSNNEITDVKEILSEVDLSFSSIDSAMIVATSLVRKTPSNFSSLCPRDSFENASAVLPFQAAPEATLLRLAHEDLEKIHQLLVTNRRTTQSTVNREIANVEKFHSKLERTFEIAESTSQDARTYLWMVPFILVILSTTTVVMMVAVHLSRKRKSNAGFQTAVSLGVLPILSAISIVVWIIAVGAAVSTTVGDDICSGGSGDGSPHDTFMAVLETFEIQPTASIYNYVSAYTGECNNGADPTAPLKLVEGDVQAAIDEIWQSLTELDAAGRSTLISACGAPAGSLDSFLLDARNLAKSLEVVQRSIENMKETLQCSRLYPIYVESVEETMCTEVAEPLAWAIVLFFVLGISTMCMISLRAAWRHEVQDPEIYNEDEEVENMYVDEHEEYLAYISKYKHEWEEYEGFDPIQANAAPPPTRPDFCSPQRVSSGGTHSDTDSSEKESHLVGEEFFEDEHFLKSEALKPEQAKDNPFRPSPLDTYSPTTAASGEFSFLSWRDETPTHPFEAQKDDNERPSAMLGRSNSPLFNAEDEMMERLAADIEQQRTHDDHIMHKLSRDIEWQSMNEFSVTKKPAPTKSSASMPESKVVTSEQRQQQQPPQSPVAGPSAFAESEVKESATLDMILTKSTESLAISVGLTDVSDLEIETSPQRPSEGQTDTPSSGHGDDEEARSSPLSMGVIDPPDTNERPEQAPAPIQVNQSPAASHGKQPDVMHRDDSRQSIDSNRLHGEFVIEPSHAFSPPLSTAPPTVAASPTHDASVDEEPPAPLDSFDDDDKVGKLGSPFNASFDSPKWSFSPPTSPPTMAVSPKTPGTPTAAEDQPTASNNSPPISPPALVQTRSAPILKQGEGRSPPISPPVIVESRSTPHEQSLQTDGRDDSPLTPPAL